MIKALFAAIAIFFASIFGGHQVAAPSQPAAAVVSNNTTSVSSPTSTGSTPSTTAPVTPSFSPVQESATKAAVHRAPVEQTVTQGIVLGTTTDILPKQSLAQLQAQIAGLQVQINQLLSAQHTAVYSGGAPAVQTFLGNTIPPALPSTLRASDIPTDITASNYLPLSGGTLTGALSSTASATSTFANGFDISGGCFAVNGTCVTGGGSSQWTTLSSNIYYNTGNVGIGTTNPTSKLEVNGDIRISSGSGGRLYFGDGSSVFTATANGTGIESWNDLNFNTGGQMTVNTGNGTATTTKFIVTNAGNVGIGTTTPFATLSVQANTGNPSTIFAVSSTTASGTKTIFSVADNLDLPSYNGAADNTSLVTFTQGRIGTPTSDLSAYEESINGTVAEGDFGGALHVVEKGLNLEGMDLTYAGTSDGMSAGEIANFTGIGTFDVPTTYGTGGFNVYIYNTGTANSNGESWAFSSYLQYDGSATDASLAGYDVGSNYNGGSGTITQNTGVLVHPQQGVGETNYGILVDDQGTGANDYAIKVLGGKSVFGGNIGVATDTPWRTLSVTGSVGFDGLTGAVGAGSLCLSANKEVVYNSGSDNCLSSLRSTKHNINNLTLSGTSTVAALVPVSFIYNNDASSTVRYGFIAEDTAAVDAHFGTYDQSGKLSGVDDRAILSIIVRALQELIGTVQGFAQKFTTQELCVGITCINQQQLAGLLALEAQQGPIQISNPTPPTISGTSTPPSISIAGNNPASIHVGDIYTDLGAIVTDSQGNSLGYKTFLNGTLVSNIVIDTGAVATDTIDYVATNTYGNTATSTRTVIIAASSTPPTSPPTDTTTSSTSTDATTSAATSTSQ